MNKTYQLTNIVYDFTVAFCKLYVAGAPEARSMVCLALSVKKKAQSGYLSQLQEKYEDFLDKNDLEVWLGYSLQLRRVKGIAFRPYGTFSMYRPFLSSPERAANAAICLIKQINFRLEAERAKSALDYTGGLIQTSQ